MNMNLENKSIEELKVLRTEIDRLIAFKLENQKSEVLKKLQTMASEAGYSLSELIAESTTRRRRNIETTSKSEDGRAKVAPKYRNPNNPTETWTGRGKQPRWFATALAQGLSEKALLIQA